jgi:hypothetical protein
MTADLPASRCRRAQADTDYWPDGRHGVDDDQHHIGAEP